MTGEGSHDMTGDRPHLGAEGGGFEGGVKEGAS